MIHLLPGNIEVIGVGWGVYVLKRPGRIAAQWQALLPHLASGALKAPIDSILPLDRAAEALCRIDERRATGTMVLQP